MTAVFFDSYFGDLGASGAQGNAVLTVTDGDLAVSWLSNPGFTLLHDGYADATARLKGGGSRSGSSLAHGSRLKHAVFDDVVAGFSFALRFGNTDDMERRIDELEELLLVRAVRYWTDRNYHKPVWLERKLDGASNKAYALVDSAVSFERPPTYFDNTVPLNRTLQPFRVQIMRKPFWEGAQPGTTQKAISLAATQSWNFDQSWGIEASLPSGSVFSLVELSNGDIYAGGASEILFYDKSADSWAAATTSPVTLSSEDITAAVLLASGDILFGSNGRILKLSGSTWSEETTLPSGQVWSIIEATNGTIYAADNGQILKRVGGTWSVDDTLPSGQVYSLHQATGGLIYAGATGEILRTAVATTSTDLTAQVGSDNDDAEQNGSSMDLDSNDLDIFRSSSGSHVGVRFTVNIPQGATINSAVLRFTARDNQTSGTPSGTIYADDSDDAAAFTSSDDDISGRTATTAQVTWDSVGSWISGERYDTPDISSVVQEVVNRGSWASGNSMVLIVETVTGSQRSAVSHDYAPSDAPQLIVSYSQALAAGDTWEVNSTLPTGNVRSLAESGGVIFAGEDGQIFASSNNGESWQVVSGVSPTNEVRALLASGSTIYAGDNGNVRKSTDGGNTWAVDTADPTGYVHGLLISASGPVYAGDSGQILSLSTTDFDLGQPATTNNRVFLANHHSEANLTHILNDDGGSFSSIFPGSSFPLSLFPGTAAANDNVYFGCDTSLSDSGPFSGLVFDIDTPASATTSYTIAWEYWNGSAWSALPVQDNTGSLGLVGVNTVVWEMPSDWATTAVNSTTGYWVRARLSALSGTFTNPTQATRDIYAPVTAFAEIAATQVLGNIDSLAKLHLTNRADNDGPSGSAPDLYANRLVGGMKPTENHANFRAFLNWSDEQNPDGVSVSTAVDGDSATSLVNSTSAATGRAVFFDASSATLDTMADRVALTLNTTVARDYYGTYKVFLRGKQTGGSAGEVTVRLKAVSGSGGISSLTETQALQGTNDHELIEFDELIHLPVSSLLTSSELGDQMQIVLQVATAAADADFYAYDLFLLPTDKMYFDCRDTANTSASAIDNGARLAVDSVTVPKALVRSLVQKTASGTTKAAYLVDSNGRLRLLAKEGAQRLWLLAARTTSTSDAVWLSPPEIVHSAQAWATDRWLTGRGGN